MGKSPGSLPPARPRAHERGRRSRVQRCQCDPICGIQGATSDSDNVELGNFRLAIRMAMPWANVEGNGLQRFNPFAWMLHGGLRLGFIGSTICMDEPE